MALNIFASQAGPIPLAQLDYNFANVLALAGGVMTGPASFSAGMSVTGPYTLGATAVAVQSFETPNSRFYVGDGTGYNFKFAKRVGSVTTDLFTFTDDGRFSGTALHNNTVPTGTVNQAVASGTWTPSLTNSFNITSSAAFACQWIRVGNVVICSGQVNCTPTAASAALLLMSLPIAANDTTNGNMGGAAVGGSYKDPCAIYTDGGSPSKATFSFTATNTGVHDYYFTFMYVVL